MEKSLPIVPARVAHRIPPRFLVKLGTTAVETKFKNKFNCPINIFSLTDKEMELGVIYECAEPLPKDGNVTKLTEDMKLRLALRKNLSLPILPKVIDYDIIAETGKIKMTILLEPFGKSIAEKVKESALDYLPNVPTWLFYSIRSLLYLSRCGAFPRLIGPELIYLKDNCVKFLDLDDVASNPAWTIDVSIPNTTWRNERWQAEQILYPPALSPLGKSKKEFVKLQTYFLAASFLTLLAGEKFIKELNEVITRGGALRENIWMFLKAKKLNAKQRAGSMAGFKKIWLLLSKCISCCTGACPTLEELDSLLENIQEIPYKELKSQLNNKCGNCGEKLIGRVVAPAYCTGLIVCQSCSTGKECTMCGSKHRLGYADDLHLRLVRKENSLEYKVYPPMCVLSRSKTRANICILLLIVMQPQNSIER